MANNATENKTAFASMFRKSAQKSVNGSPVMVDDNGNKRKKYQGRDIAVAFPDGVYIADFDIIAVNDRNNPGVKKSMGIYAFSDKPDGAIVGYTNGGANISRMIADWVNGIGEGDITTTRNAYKDSGARVHVKISYSVDASTGNNIQNVEVL